MGGDTGILHPQATATGLSATCGVKLPHGTVITAALVEGIIAADWFWYLFRSAIGASSTGTKLGSGLARTENTGMNVTVNNQSFKYWLLASGLNANDDVHGARITYTTGYD